MSGDLQKVTDLLGGLFEKQLSDEEATDIADAYFAKRAELKGQSVSEEQPKTAIELIFELDARMTRLEKAAGLIP